MAPRTDSTFTGRETGRVRASVAALLLAFCMAGSAQAQIYFLDDDQIWTAEIDGSDAAVLVENADKPRGIAVDPDGGYLYWTDDWEFDGQILRASLDGSGAEVLHEQGTPRGIAIDTDNGKVFWADLRNDGALLRANLDGSDVETLVTGETGGNTDGILDVALDLVDGKVYWTRIGGIMRADLDGANVELFVELASHVQPPSVDVASGYVYWVNPSLDDIERSATDEPAVETVVSADEPEGVAIEGDRLYWLNSFLLSGGGGNVFRADLDGTNPEMVMDELSFPEGPLAVIGDDTDTAVEDPRELPATAALVDVYPTPFRGAATVSVELERSQVLVVDVIDVLGRRVAALHEGRLSAGRHDLPLHADLAAGLFFVRVRTAAVIQTAPLLSVR